MSFNGVTSVVGEAYAPQLFAVEHVLDRVETLGTWLKNRQRGIIVCAQRHLWLCRPTAFEQGADDEVVRARLERHVFAVGLRAVHVDLACFQTGDAKGGFGVGGCLCIKRQGRNGERST